MPRFSPLQGDFSAGEFSPLLYGKVENPRYKAGLALCENMIPMLQGPITRRAGTVFVSPTKFTTFTRLIPFKYSQTQDYILEFGNNYVRFYTQRSQIVVGSTPYELVSPYSAAELPEVKYAQSLDVLYLVHPNHPPYVLNRYGNEDWTLIPAVFKDGPYLNVGVYPINIVTINAPAVTSGVTVSAGGAGATVTISTTAVAANISNVTNNGSGLVRITINSATSPPNFYADRSQVFISGVVGATEANGTWIVSQVSPFVYDLIGSTFTSAYVSGGEMYPGPFRSGDVGRYIRYAQNPSLGVTVWAYLQITSVTDGAHASGFVIYTDPGFNTTIATPTQYFSFGVYNPVDGYPSCVTFHEDRLWFGAPGISLVRMDGSNVSEYLNFAPSLTNDGTVTASNACSFSLNSHDGNAIVWMKSDELGMPVGTAGGPWIVKPSILSEAISPTNISAKKVNNVGSAQTDGITCAKSTVFLETSTRKVRELTYFYQIGGFRSIDLTEIAEHLPYEGITTEVVYQSVPVPIIWCARADGTLLGITYDRQLDDLRCGWHRHYLGGASDASGTPPLISSLGVIPSPPLAGTPDMLAQAGGLTDDVWMVVTRLVNGAQVQYVEYLSRIFQDFDAPQDAFFVDCGATYDISLSISAITNANPAQVTSAGHGLTTGDLVRLGNVIGLLDGSGDNTINNIPFTVTVIDADNFTLNGYDSTALTPYTAGTGYFNKLVTTISGITWLEGQTVNILADGFVLPPVTVTAGTITLQTAAGIVNFGLPITAKMQQLVLEGGSADGTSIGKNRRANELSIMVHRSGAFNIGVDFTPDDMVTVSFRQPSDPMDAATPLFSGIQDRVQLLTNYDLYNQIAVEISDPTPFTLVAIMPQVTTYDKA